MPKCNIAHKENISPTTLSNIRMLNTKIPISILIHSMYKNISVCYTKLFNDFNI